MDTGANCCVLAEHMIPPDQLVRPLPPTLKIRGVGGHEIDFKGITTVPMGFPEIGPEIYCYYDMLVCAGSLFWAFDGIIGLSFLIDFGATFSATEMRLTLQIGGAQLKVTQMEESVYLDESANRVRGILAEISTLELKSADDGENNAKLDVWVPEPLVYKLDKSTNKVSCSNPKLELEDEEIEMINRIFPNTEPQCEVSQEKELSPENLNPHKKKESYKEMEDIKPLPHEINPEEAQECEEKDKEESIPKKESIQVDSEEKEKKKPPQTREIKINALGASVRTLGRYLASTKSSIRLAPRTSAVCYLSADAIDPDNFEIYEFSPVTTNCSALTIKAQPFFAGHDLHVVAELNNLSCDILSIDAQEVLGVLDPMEGDDVTKYIAYHDFLPEETQPKPLEDYFELSRVPDAHKAKLIKILYEHEQAFMTHGKKLGTTHLVDFKIELLSNAVPVARPPIRCPIQFQEQYETAVREMVEDNIIALGESPWASPIIPVRRKKADGSISLRLACDLRIPNFYTKSYNMPLPLIGEMLSSIPQTVGTSAPYILSCLDIKLAFWQVPITDKTTREVLSVVTTSHQYLMNRMPFGAKNASAKFLQLITKALGTIKGVLYYCDDILLITGPDWHMHLELLNLVMKKLSDAGLTLSPAKCQFGLSELTFVGHLICQEGISPSPEKLDVIHSFPRPSKVKEVRSWIGMCSWFRRFIPDFSKIVAPLTALTKKDAAWEWTSICEESWLTLKRALTSKPVLAFPSPDLPYVVMADASSYCIAGVLLQETSEGQKAISYHSRMLNKSQQNYSTTEREALAIIFVITQNKYLLLGTKFTVLTDHAPLSILTSLRSSSSPRLARWALTLSEYDFVLKHKPGKQMDLVDCLSRPPRNEEEQKEEAR